MHVQVRKCCEKLAKTKTSTFFSTGMLTRTHTRSSKWLTIIIVIVLMALRNAYRAVNATHDAKGYSMTMLPHHRRHCRGVVSVLSTNGTSLPIAGVALACYLPRLIRLLSLLFVLFLWHATHARTGCTLPGMYAHPPLRNSWSEQKRLTAIVLHVTLLLLAHRWLAVAASYMHTHV